MCEWLGKLCYTSPLIRKYADKYRIWERSSGERAEYENFSLLLYKVIWMR